MPSRSCQNVGTSGSRNPVESSRPTMNRIDPLPSETKPLPPGHLDLALDPHQSRLAVPSEGDMQSFGSVLRDLLRGQRQDDARPALHLRPAEQLVDDLVSARLNSGIALQHRLGLYAQQLGGPIQRDDEVLAYPPRRAGRTDRRFCVIHCRRFPSEAAASH